jgi:hypothetical protein
VSRGLAAGDEETVPLGAPLGAQALEESHQPSLYTKTEAPQFQTSTCVDSVNEYLDRIVVRLDYPLRLRHSLSKVE